MIFTEFSFASDDFCKKYPRLKSCICETTKSNLSEANTVFALLLIIVDKTKTGILSTDMQKITHTISKTGQLVSKELNNSLKYKCYKQTAECHKTLKNLSQDTQYISKASKAISELRTATLKYQESQLKKYDAVTKSTFYATQSKFNYNKYGQKASLLKQEENIMRKITEAREDKINTLISDIELNIFQARHFRKHKKDFMDHCVEIYEKSLKEIMKNENLKAIEI